MDLKQLPAECWPAFSRLLDELLQQPPAQQADWLAALPAEHAALRGYLQAALQAEASLLAEAPATRPRLASPPPDPEALVFNGGDRVGPYELCEPLGHGGMGEVWRARRADGALTRDVALKLPYAWLLSAGMRRRLSRERDILAGLTHVNIAQIYDAGLTEGGQPWLALERIEGLHIDQHCRMLQLSLPARLALIDQVLEAVQSAHARLVVHRDLKPANILVTQGGTVKLLDFGIAKLLDPQGSGESTELTRLTGRAATPEYAAPEQLAGEAVTVATDVYALGVVLYELLCGQRPFSVRRHPAPSETARGVPPLASTQLLPRHAEQVGQHSTESLRRALRGDLDAILAKALAPRPRDRYASVDQFAEDLRRHRRREPILARHIGRLERAVRFVSRHRLGLGVAALFMLTLAGGLAASLWQARRATAEASRANATRDFLLDVIRSSSRVQVADKTPGSTTLREMLDAIVDGLDTGLALQPQTRLDLLLQACKIYRQWYDRPRLVRAHEQTRRLLEQLYGPHDPRIVESLIEQASTHFDYADIRPGERDALLAQARRLLDEDGLRGSLTEAEWLMVLGKTRFAPAGASAEAERALRASVEIHDRRQPLDRGQRWPRFHFTQALLANGKPDEARQQAQKNIAFEQTLGKQRNDWLVAWQTVVLAHAQRALGQRDAALASYTRAVSLIQATFGRGVDTYQEALLWQATLLHWRGETAKAQALFEQENALLEQEGHDDQSKQSTSEGVAWFRLAYARFLLDQGRAEQAMMLLQRAVAVDITSRPVELHQADAMLSLGEAYAALGRQAEAGEQFGRTCQAWLALGAPTVAGALQARERRARHDFAQGDLPAARAAWEQVLDQAGGQPLPTVALARMGLAELALQRGDRPAALRLGTQALADLAGVTALYDPRILRDLQVRHAALQRG